MNAVGLVDKVQNLYAAFDKGDIATIIMALAPEIDWRVNIDASLAGADHPLFRQYFRAADVPGFFEGLMTSFEPKGMQVRGIATTLDGHGVLVLLTESYVVRKTGKPVTFDTCHHWTFDDAAKVVAWRGYTDSAAELASLR